MTARGDARADEQSDLLPSRYRTADGSVARGPTGAPLPMKVVTVKGSIITVS